MAFRLGFKPWEYARLQPAEVWALWDAWLWRRSREIELMAVSTLWQVKSWGAKVDNRKVIQSYPGYEEDKG